MWCLILASISNVSVSNVIWIFHSFRMCFSLVLFCGWMTQISRCCYFNYKQSLQLVFPEDVFLSTTTRTTTITMKTLCFNTRGFWYVNNFPTKTNVEQWSLWYHIRIFACSFSRERVMAFFMRSINSYINGIRRLFTFVVRSGFSFRHCFAFSWLVFL